MAQNSVPYTLSITFNGSSGLVAGVASGDNLISIVDLIGTSTTNKEYTCTVAAAGLTGWYLLATNALTVKTNSTGAPANTFTLVANIPQFWITGVSGTNPISTDITKLYVTNGSGSNTAQLTVYFVGDNSP